MSPSWGIRGCFHSRWFKACFDRWRGFLRLEFKHGSLKTCRGHWKSLGSMDVLSLEIK